MSLTLTHRALTARRTAGRSPSAGSVPGSPARPAHATVSDPAERRPAHPAAPVTCEPAAPLTSEPAHTAITDPAEHVPAGPVDRQVDPEAGMATAEYAIATVAAAGFAGLLVVILRSAEVRELLLGIIRSALSV
ncbi:DUF4244 domain-containing protein [uncultured Cellulomonas sp.]|uniref:DUF4244 domain-containing protein n=1 Tax=uncultured Cellulomonas sp. TaxID=189682 RepID=UPI0026266F6E|nr:DUF4244 domain-containing protein [uncultured Cellulomonas sp.]